MRPERAREKAAKEQVSQQPDTLAGQMPKNGVESGSYSAANSEETICFCWTADDSLFSSNLPDYASSSLWVTNLERPRPVMCRA